LPAEVRISAPRLGRPPGRGERRGTSASTKAWRTS